jgi:hypothetical protein
MPASTRISGPSTSSTRAMRSSEISVPEVSTAPVNECPAPATRTGPIARSSTAASSAREPGRSIVAGSHRCVRDQLTHAATPGG